MDKLLINEIFCDYILFLILNQERTREERANRSILPKKFHKNNFLEYIIFDKSQKNYYFLSESTNISQITSIIS